MTTLTTCPDIARGLSVVIPVFNEESRLEGTVRQISGYLEAKDYDFEIIIVDDGSVDRTPSVARSLLRDVANTSMIRFAENHGKGFAVCAGVLAASHEAVLFSDADHSTPIAEIEKFWPWFDRGYAVVIGSRRLDGSLIVKRQTPLREFLGSSFGRLVNLLALRGIEDTQCGFKLFERGAARRLFSRLRTRGFAFDVEVLLRARSAGCRIAEVPIRWTDDRSSRIRPFQDSLRMLLELLRMRGIL